MRKQLAFLFASVFSFAAFSQTYNMQAGVNIIQTCGGTFYDSGGSGGNYASSFNGVTTFYPSTPGAKMQLTFTSFGMESCCDYFYVYNGNSTTAPALVNGVNGNALPNGGNTITSTAADGSLTVKFTSDGSVSGTGWAATLGCATQGIAACNGDVTGVIAGTNASVGGFGSTVTLTAQNVVNSGLSFQWQSAPSENGPWTDIAGMNNYIASVQAPNYATITYYRMQVTCTASSSITYSSVASYTTEPIFTMSNGTNSYTTCEGTFLDSGGALGEYLNYESGVVTLYPSTPGASVVLQFTQFELESCCDYLSIYNGNSTAATQLFSGNGLTIPNNGNAIISTAADGSLTISFTSDVSGTYEGWLANISCISACNGPVVDLSAVLSHSSGIAGSTITATVGVPSAANVSYQWQTAASENGPWTNIAGATNFTSVITAPSVEGISFYRLQVTCNTTSDVTYTNVVSFSVLPSTLMTAGQSTISACEGIFVDNGGNNNYSNNFSGTTTFIPTSPTQAVTLQFTSFRTEGYNDIMSIYNGGSTLSPVIISEFGGQNLPLNGQVITSTSLDGSLTVHFETDGSLTYAGWEAVIGCTTSMHPLCDAVLTSGTTVLAHTSGGVSTLINASVTGNSQSTGIAYQWQKAPTAAGPWEDIVGAIGLNGNFSAEATIGNYYYRLMSTCLNTQITSYSTPALFTTYGQYIMNTTGNQVVTSCGISFVDSGGENGVYSNYEDGVVTFYPSSPTTQVQLTFTYFNMESPSWDKINIYNGNSTSAPVLIANHGYSNLPNNGQPIVSTAADGSLTFQFISDGSGQYGGWIANLTCLCENITETVDVEICQNQTPYYFYGEYIEETGIYTHNIPLETGCDSIITLNLLINPLLTDTNTVNACSSYFWPRTSSTYSESGIYTVTVPNADGCDSVYVLDLTVSISDLTLSVVGSTLTANQNDGVYQWLNCGQNYAVIPGATEQSYTPTESGLYACRVTYEGCTANTNCLTVNVVGVDGVSSSNFTVYPNPSKGKFTLSTNSVLNDATIEVYSVVGQLVYSGLFNGNEMIINLEDQPNGVYIIKVNDQENLRWIKSN